MELQVIQQNRCLHCTAIFFQMIQNGGMNRGRGKMKEAVNGTKYHVDWQVDWKSPKVPFAPLPIHKQTRVRLLMNI